MASSIRKKCANPECSNTCRVSYRHCDTCRANGHVANGNQFVRRDSSKPSPSSPPPIPEGQIALDRERRRALRDTADLKARYTAALKTIEQQEEALAALGVLTSHHEIEAIVPREGSGTSEATVVAVASDWHVEEEVGVEVGGLNTFNLEIAEVRIKDFFNGVRRLTRLLNQDVTIHTIVLALLGDYISNQIHGAENAEQNQLTPTHAIVWVQNQIIAGVEFLLTHTDKDLVLVCKSGNHGRTTHTTRFSSETGHSLEYLMFLSIQAYFRHEPRVKCIVEHGIHSYLDVYNLRLRFHHGHAIKYQGGVGGITIPVNKAIAQWDQARAADIDVFGHFHQYTIHNKFVCNGSLIGYNGYAMAIKAAFERPQQALFLLDKKRGKTAHWPILFSK